MIEQFKEISLNVENHYIKKFLSTGRKIIGCSYSQVPLPEVYHAAGLLCIRLRANNISATTIGDSYFGPVVCSFPKSLLQMAGEGYFKCLSGVVTSSLCDSLRRLDDCWRKAAADYDDILPEFHDFFAVPHKNYDFNREWFTEELHRHIKKMEEYFQVSLSREALRHSIRLYNQGRRLLRQFDQLRQRQAVPVTGAEALSVFIAAAAIPMEDFIELMTPLLRELETTDRAVPGHRLFIAGSVNDDPGLFESIEAAGGVIVGDMMSFGSRFYDNMIDEDGADPVADLARGYLENINHPRMFGEYQRRLAILKEKIAAARADGVILQNIRFCDLHGCENGIFERDLEAAGIPCLKLEREYGPLVETGRVKMRAQAFLDRLK